MLYPERLLPQARFYTINHDLRDIDAWLIRYTDHRDILDPHSGHLLPSCVAPQTNHLHDLSTSLLGVFTIGDIVWQIVGDNKPYFIGLWKSGETVQTPVFEQDFVQSSERGFFLLRVADLNGQQIKYNVSENDNLTAVCRVLHTPIRANFWHFSVRWFTLEGDVMKQNGSWKRRLLTSCRALICQFARFEEPDCILPPTQWYDPAPIAS